MKDKDWKIIQVLYEKQSITKAAEELYITQSALTKRIRAIEDELGVELVKRTSKGVVFTKNGQYLYRKSIDFNNFMEEIQDHLSGSQSSRTLLRIAMPSTFARLHMPKLLRAYAEQLNKLQVRTIINPSNIIIQQLIDGSVDIAIICGDYPFLGDKVRLFEEQLYVIAPTGIQLADIEHLPIIETYFNPMMKLIISQWWKQQFGTVLHEQQSVVYSEIATEMVAAGLGVYFLYGADWRVNSDSVQMIPVFDKKNEPVLRSVWLMWTERCSHDQAIMEFVDFAKDYYHVSER